MSKDILLWLGVLGLLSSAYSEKKFEMDTITTSAGPLIITFVGHGTLMFQFNSLVIHVDPVSMCGDYNAMPDADIILVTHEHSDHLDTKAIDMILKKETQILCTEACAGKVKNCIVMKNGESKSVKEITIVAIPAYNIVHKRDNGEPFHPRGRGNGYVVTFGDKKVYIGGDTENIPEMKQLKNIDIAFLPMNLPYTMTPKMVADAAAMFNPKILYPYHYGETDVNELVNLLKGTKGCETRVRNLK